MTMRPTLPIAALLALALPTAAAAQDNQQAQQTDQPQPAEQCLAQLAEMNAELVDMDYGRVGPTGYGVGMTTGAGGTLATPRGQMGVAMRAAYVFGNRGDSETCQAIVSGIQDMRQHYEEVAVPDLTGVQVDEWRAERLSAAVPVTELEGSLEMDFIDDAQLRTTDGEYLGEIEGRLVDAGSGEIRYVLVSDGGFLGIGEDLTPVPWDRLRVTPLPYRDAFVLDVTEEAFEDAPDFEEDDPEEISASDIGQRVDSYWSQQTGQ